MRRSVAILLLLGLLRMAGDAFCSEVLFGLGFASAASPGPKVFTVVGDMEPFANRFAVSWDDPSGRSERVALTPEVYSRLGGPYNRRNVYGAVLAAAPVLLDNPATASMCRSVLRHALTDDRTLLRELDLQPPAGATGLRLEYGHPSFLAPGDEPQRVVLIDAAVSETAVNQTARREGEP